MQYLTLYSYNDQGGEEAAVEAGQESTPTSLSTGAAFSCSMLESNKESFTLEAMKGILGPCQCAQMGLTLMVTGANALLELPTS
uniref:Uncharacterized protein n=1 Tax=Oreochromis niloticus TaxID=8128 RepID=A0A669ERF4_ORENI